MRKAPFLATLFTLLLAIVYVAPAAAQTVLIQDNFKRGVQYRQQTLPDIKIGRPNFKIPYKIVDKRVKKYARYAARTWNRAKLPYKFFEVQDRKDAELIIMKDRLCGHGQAEQGYSDAYNRPGKVWLSNCASKHDDRVIAVHEFGHALGLGHYGSCDLMTSGVCPSTSPRPKAKDKKRIRKMAKRRNEAVARAPKQASFTAGIDSKEEYDYDGEYYVEAVVYLRVAATFDDRKWNTPTAQLFDEFGNVTEDDSEPCDTFPFFGSIGPWGNDEGWTSEMYCFIYGGPGTYRVQATVQSKKGTELSLDKKFTFP